MTPSLGRLGPQGADRLPNQGRNWAGNRPRGVRLRLPRPGGVLALIERAGDPLAGEYPGPLSSQRPGHSARSKSLDAARKSSKLCTDVVTDMPAERLVNRLVDDEAYLPASGDQEWGTDIRLLDDERLSEEG